jgi:hypothetical protein
MNYRFTADLKDGYLHIRVQGENTPSTIRRYLDDILQTCLREGCPNVLIEEDLTGARLGVGEIFSIIHEKSAAFRPVMQLLAYVDLRATNPANMQFAEDVAVNRGATMRVFHTVAAAEQWIRERLAPPQP